MSSTNQPAGAGLVLNVVPVQFSKDTVRLGRIEFVDDDHYERLRTSNRDTHVFRFDARDRSIANVSIRSGVMPLGVVCDDARVHDHLPLMGKLLQHFLLEWLQKGRTILRRSRPIIFRAGNADSQLLSRAIEECGLSPQTGLEVAVRYSFDTRVLEVPKRPNQSYLALLIELRTSNIIEIPLNDLIRRGMNLTGRYVCRKMTIGEDRFCPNPHVLGAVAEIDRNNLLLTDNVGEDRVAISDVWLEARPENMEAVLQVLYPRNAGRILARLQHLRAAYLTADGKLMFIRQTLNALKDRLTIATEDRLTLSLTELLTPASALFPSEIETKRPNMLFGHHGRNTSPYPDASVQRWGPFKYLQNERNEPVVAVICEARYRGRIEQFVEALRHGFPDETWDAATSWMKKKEENPYRGGLIGKFRLRRIALEYEEVPGPDPRAYRQAARRLLERLPKNPDLALVQLPEGCKTLYGDSNPYFVTKAVFMQAGVPVQAVHKDTVELREHQLPKALNNMGLACYAKLGGVPWVISLRNPTAHELVIGMGYTETARSRLARKSRYVGITTLFQGDGRYQVWGMTREVEFGEYAPALLESLRTTVRYVREKNDWQPGDAVRLIFHVYKPLKYKEMEAIKELVSGLISEEYEVKYAFIDISRHHAYDMFDRNQPGHRYGSGQQQALRGVGVPQRGTALQLDARTALLQLIGPRDLKLDYQGLPQPLRIELHEASDFDDLSYLVRQVFHFTYISWRSFFPASEPVTIVYSRWIAKALGSLKPVDGWNSSALTMGPLRSGMWFL